MTTLEEVRARFARDQGLPFTSALTEVSILDALMPLGELTGRGMATLLLHHPRKRTAAPGQAARGHGALLGHIDIATTGMASRL